MNCQTVRVNVGSVQDMGERVGFVAVYIDTKKHTIQIPCGVSVSSFHFIGLLRDLADRIEKMCQEEQK